MARAEREYIRGMHFDQEYASTHIHVYAVVVETFIHAYVAVLAILFHASLALETKGWLPQPCIAVQQCVYTWRAHLSPFHSSAAIRSAESEAVCQIPDQPETFAFHSLPNATISRPECPWHNTMIHYKTLIVAVRYRKSIEQLIERQLCWLIYFSRN